MANTKDTAKAKAASNAKKAQASTQSKKVADNVSATKKAEADKALTLIRGGDVPTDGTLPVMPSAEGKGDAVITPPAVTKYTTTGARLGFKLATSVTDKTKPKDVEYVATEEQIAEAKRIKEAKPDELGAIFLDLSRNIETMQGAIHCASVGLAERLQLEGVQAFEYIDSFVKALEPLGKQLSVVQANPIRLWFAQMAACKLAQINGEGPKVLQFDQDRWASNNVAYHRNPDAWVKRRFAKTAAILSPEKELGDYVFLTGLMKFMDSAAKVYSADIKGEAGKRFKKVDLFGYAEAMKALDTIKRVAMMERQLAAQATDAADSEPMEEDQTAEEQAA